MKIGILTFHCAHSYGAVLQATALKYFLEKRGHDVRFINYRPPSLVFKTKGIGNTINQWIFSRYEKKYLAKQTSEFNTTENIPEDVHEVEVYIVGSDQVWNPDFSRGEDLTYFLNFVRAGKKRISYAASFGKEELDFDESKKDTIKKELKKFDAVAVRESSGIKLLKSEFGIAGEQTADPTFLLTSQDYQNLFNIDKPEIKGQMLCFKFHQNAEFFASIKEIGKKHNLDIVSIGRPKFFQGFKTRSYPSVIKWIELFYTSEYVYTDSFHGLAFSILFQKKFVVMPANIKRFTRIKDLLERLGLADRIFYTYQDIVASDSWLREIDYKKVNEKLDAYRKHSASFLNKEIA